MQKFILDKIGYLMNKLISKVAEEMLHQGTFIVVILVIKYIL